MSEVALFAIDIEQSGPVISIDKIISIGICCIKLFDGSLIYKGKINLEYGNIENFDKTTYDEFWSSRLLLLNELSQNQVSPIIGIQQFYDVYCLLDSQYDLRVISDNVASDIAFINYYLGFYLQKPGMLYTRKNKYRPVFDTDSFHRGIIRQNYNDVWTYDSNVITECNLLAGDLPTRDHRPENDAHYIAELHRRIILAM